MLYYSACRNQIKLQTIASYIFIIILEEEYTLIDFSSLASQRPRLSIEITQLIFEVQKDLVKIEAVNIITGDSKLNSKTNYTFLAL